MKPQSIHHFQDWFEALHTTDLTQVAMMRLDPGSESGPDLDSHPNSDQVLLVIEGSIKGKIGEESIILTKGEFITIPADMPHRFYNDSDNTALTFNVYAPPAYPPNSRG